MSGALRVTPLHARHVEAGARLVPFAGFEMPLLYRSIVAEHLVVRSSAGLFDVSHMGEIVLHGADAVTLAQRVFSNDVAETAVGRVRYGLLCQADGGVLDDVTLYRLAPETLLLCVNATNTRTDLEWIEQVRRDHGFACEVRDESEETALLALQGPRAREIARELRPAQAPEPRRWRFLETTLAGIPLRLSRTGYTGEDGYELYVASERAEALWDALCETGGERLSRAGLGARDTLRTEMGFPLYGHELTPERSPIAAGLERFLAFGRGFIGEEALRRERERGPRERLVGLMLEGRQVARSGYPILEDERVGTVSSGTYGPSVERSIAIGYVPPRCAARGTRLSVEVRGRRVPCQVSELPFYRRGDGGQSESGRRDDRKDL
ncbi:MAG: glycine cleavage system aminomethyltransferase GcvT [Myxococcota bacterium]